MFVAAAAFAANPQAFADSIRLNRNALFNREQLATLLSQYNGAVRAYPKITILRLGEVEFERRSPN